ncbi:MAG TPA: M20 family peptidase [Flavilitoribacter sp.]|nr:M20 family peptidase [Flavilitoribacter sp.]HMQ88401.1 M20 family peptidase [Flavilitoribacter sp.]
MRKFFRRIFRFLFLAILVILAIVIFKTYTYHSMQVAIDPIPKSEVNEKAPERLAGAVRFETVSFEDHMDTLPFLNLDTFLQTAFPKMFERMERIDVASPSILLKWAGAKPMLPPVLLMGHLDVVPAEKETIDDWAEGPFSGKLGDGFVWGRGTLDDKLNVMGLLESANTLLEQDYQPERTLYFSFGHDEELGGRNGAAKIADYFKDQGIRFEYVLDEGLLILDGALPGLSRPLAMIGTSEKGEATLKLEVKLDEGGHSSMPPAETAIGVLSEALNRLHENPCPARLDGPTLELLQHAGPETSPFFRALFANTWLTKGMLIRQFSQSASSNAVVRTTTAPTIVHAGVKSNVLPSTGYAMVNFRIIPGETPESVADYVEKTIREPRIAVSIMPGAVPPSPVSPTNTFGFQAIEKTIRQIFPEAVVSPALVIAQTDSRHFTGLSDAVYRFTPVRLTKADLSRIHGINERISVDGYKDLLRFYGQLIVNSTQ